jgi:hypothetical protein
MVESYNEDEHDFILHNTDLDSGLLLVKILNHGKHKETLYTDRLCDRLILECIRTIFGQQPLDCVGTRRKSKSEESIQDLF